MKYIWIILKFLLFISCSNNERFNSNGYIKREFKLLDLETEKPFAIIKLLVPSKYDTLLMWTNMSDCTCCHLRMYRFTNSKGCLLQESGFLPSASCQDSVDMLTFYHKCGGHHPCYKDINMVEFNEELQKSETNRAKRLSPPIIWKNRSLRLINGHKFGIYESFSFDCNDEHPSYQIGGSTKVKYTNNCTKIYFDITCNQNICQNFSSVSYEILNSIQIDTIPQ